MKRDFGLRIADLEIGIWDLEIGNWNLGFGKIWKLEFGIWKLEIGIGKLEFGVRILGKCGIWNRYDVPGLEQHSRQYFQVGKGGLPPPLELHTRRWYCTSVKRISFMQSTRRV
jgi:hypothetical protein